MCSVWSVDMVGEMSAAVPCFSSDMMGYFTMSRRELAAQRSYTARRSCKEIPDANDGWIWI
jgi:hypothetical protein